MFVKHSNKAENPRGRSGAYAMLAATALILNTMHAFAAPATNSPPRTQVRPFQPPSTTTQPASLPDLTVAFKNASCNYNANLQKYVVNFKAKIQNFSGNPTTNSFKTKVSSPMGNLQAQLAANPGNPKVSPPPMQGWTEWGYGVSVNTPGKYTLILQIDFEGSQPETNEANNFAQYTVGCKQ